LQLTQRKLLLLLRPLWLLLWPMRSKNVGAR